MSARDLNSYELGVQPLGEVAVDDEAAKLTVRRIDPGQIRLPGVVEGDVRAAVLAGALELPESLYGRVDGVGIAKLHGE